MRKVRTPFVAALAVALAACALVAATALGSQHAHASSAGRLVGVGDENPQMFTNPAWVDLQAKIARFFTAYDVASGKDPTALARLQATLPQITKAGSILDRAGAVRNKYAKLEDIDVVIRPLCATEGFSFSFDSKPAVKGTDYSCAMQHCDGHTETKTLNLPPDEGGGRGAVQSAGSALSYAKRYLLGMHLHLVTRDEDTDGHAYDPITPEQAVELRASLAESGGSEERFLKYLNAETFEAIRGDQLAKARSLIEEKKRQKVTR